MTLELKTDDDYLAYFYNCLKNINTIEKYEPVKAYLFTIFDRYYSFQLRDKQVYQGKIKDPKYAIEFCKTVLKLFNRILNENKLNNLSEYIDFVLYLDFFPHDIPPLLETLLFKEETDYEQYFGDYQFYMNTFAHGSLGVKELVNYNSNLRIVQLLKSYVSNFYTSFSYYDIKPNTPEWERRAFYMEIGKFVVGCAYKTDVDLNKVDDFLYDLANNTVTLKERLMLNGLLYFDENDWYNKVRNLKDVLANYSKQDKLIR